MLKFQNNNTTLIATFKDFIIMDRPNFAFIFCLYSIYIYFMGEAFLQGSETLALYPQNDTVHTHHT